MKREREQERERLKEVRKLDERRILFLAKVRGKAY